MEDRQALLRGLPKVDEVLQDERLFLFFESTPRPLIVETVREAVEDLRAAVLRGETERIPSRDELVERITGALTEKNRRVLRRVLNATGVVLHTNLGRARLSAEASRAVGEIADSYCTLEYDIRAGARGSRQDIVEGIVCRVTGAEAAMAVNNNAAATMLVLAALARGQEVVVSRGELVEIGGSFRIPDVMSESGAVLREVGTTNKTRVADYRSVWASGVTGAFMKVHTSNYRIVGFTEDVPLASMAELGRELSVPVIYDMGNGLLADLSRYGLEEPTVTDALKAGADVVLFSGDKLLGGPQAGIIVGRKTYIDRMKSHPLARAFRVDKMTLAALEATLRLYLDPRDAMEEIPTLKMLAVTLEQLEAKANRLRDAIAAKTSGCALSVIEELGQVGGGSVPTQMLKSRVVAIVPSAISVMELEKRLRACPVPVIGRINKDQYLLDVRTIEESDFDLVAENIAACVQ